MVRRDEGEDSVHDNELRKSVSMDNKIFRGVPHRDEETDFGGGVLFAGREVCFQCELIL